MTPLGSKLLFELDNELRRMENEWFFKWHYIGKDGPVEIDGFDGRKITLGNVTFWGSPREVYWQTLHRYLRNKIAEIFANVETEIKTYPRRQMAAAINEAEEISIGFVDKILHAATTKDKTLRGNGFTFPPPDLGKGEALKGMTLPIVTQRVEALRDHYQTNSKLVDFEHFLREYNASVRTITSFGAGGIIVLIISKIISWILK